MALELKKDDEYTKLDIDTSVIEDEELTEKPVKLKEYQKLLIQEENRLKAVKAKKMVKMGLFDQYSKGVDEFSLTQFKKLDYIKPYKNHELFEGIDGTLYYIASKNEASEENPNAKTYSYDVIELDNVDEATYQKLLKANAHENNFAINLAFVGSIVFLIYSLISSIYSLVYFMVDGNYDFFTSFFTAAATQFIQFGISLSLFVIAAITKRKFDTK